MKRRIIILQNMNMDYDKKQNQTNPTRKVNLNTGALRLMIDNMVAIKGCAIIILTIII